MDECKRFPDWNIPITDHKIQDVPSLAEAILRVLWVRSGDVISIIEPAIILRHPGSKEFGLSVEILAIEAAWDLTTGSSALSRKGKSLKPIPKVNLSNVTLLSKLKAHEKGSTVHTLLLGKHDIEITLEVNGGTNYFYSRLVFEWVYMTGLTGLSKRG